MIRLTGIKCASLITALFTLGLCSVSNATAQDSSGGAMGGLRGPQDIINSVNNRDSYGNPLPGSSATGAYGGDPGAAAGGDPAGSIHPFTPAGSYQGSPAGVGGGAYLPPPTPGSYNGAPSPYQNGSTPFQGSNQPAPSYKHHHQHRQKNSSQSNQYQNQAQSLNQGPGGYPGQPGQYQNQYQSPQQDPSIASQTYPNAGMSGPPGATYAGNHKGGSGGGNSSIGGAAVGVPDRAAKTAVGVSGKAAKEVLKALF